MFKYFNSSVKFLMFFALTVMMFGCYQGDLNDDVAELSIDVNAFSIDPAVATDQENLDPESVELRTSTNDYYTFHTLNQALRCTELTGALFSGSKTIYAPSDAAFKKLGLNAHNVCQELDEATLSNILLYHVVDRKVTTSERGCLEMINGDIAQLSVKDHRLFINESRLYYAFNQSGRHYKLRVYAIDEVLMPAMPTIAEAAAETDKFQVLFEAVVAADPAIAAALSDPDAIFTVFAPTNQAFVDLLNALGLSSLEELVGAIGVDGLSTVLLYHVVDACAFSNDLKDDQMIQTLQGESVKIDLDNLAIQDKTADQSNLVLDCLDIRTTNGIVHTIDKVLLPNELLMNL